MEALLRYLDAERGRRIILAATLGITPGAISQWQRVPVDRLMEISEATGIPRDELRPDLFAGFVPAPSQDSAA